MAMHVVLEAIQRWAGIAIKPGWIVRERLANPGGNAPPLPDGYEIQQVSDADATVLSSVTPTLHEELVLERLNAGHIGFKIIHQPQDPSDAKGEEVVGYTWANPTSVHEVPESYTLLENEAYLYDTHVLPSHRGGGLASIVRAACYERLNEQGYTSFVSISERFNLPSVKFKKRLGGKPEKLYLSIRKGKKRVLYVTLRKKYQQLPRAWR